MQASGFSLLLESISYIQVTFTVPERGRANALEIKVVKIAHISNIQFYP